MPFMIPVLLVVSAAVAAYGAYQQGQSAKKAAAFNAQVANQNAVAARQQSAAEMAQHDRETYMRLGSIRAAQGASGGTMEGSALDVLGDTASQAELEKQNIKYRGEMQARGFGNTATLERFQGKAAARAGTLKAGSELIGGAASAYGSSLNRTG
jgi:hypothetical protein